MDSKTLHINLNGSFGSIYSSAESQRNLAEITRTFSALKIGFVQIDSVISSAKDELEHEVP